MEQKKILKIYTDKKYLPDQERYIVLLYPFWGVCPDSSEGVDTGRFDDYVALGPEFFSLVPSLKDADVAVLPFEWRAKSQWGNKYNHYLELALSFENEASQLGKRLIVFFNNDSEEPIPIQNAVIFRTSFCRSTRRTNEFAVPGWSIDFLYQYLEGDFKVRGKNNVPVVCYSGYVDYDVNDMYSMIKHGLKLLVGWKPNIQQKLRGGAVRTLQRDSRVTMNFLLRNGFSGGCDDKTRKEYVLNMVDSDYALVIRGAGNFSYRLYEVLSCGRIPVFIDTDCVLPFDDIIDWKKYCVWVDSTDVDKIGDNISEFHEKITDTEFEEMQISIRRLYEEWICPVGFYKNIWRYISG